MMRIFKRRFIVCQEAGPTKTRHGANLLWLISATLILVGLILASARGATPPAAKSRHVLLISVDGMSGHLYAAPSPQARIPNLRRFMKEGSYAEGVIGVYPSVTYPSHTTLMTGRLPAEHGVYSNLSSRVAGKNPDDWFWFSSAIKVPTVWDEVRQARLTSASVSWPVTVGAPIDWNVPEIWDPNVGSIFDAQFVAKYATPGLLEEALAALGPARPDENNDSLRTRMVVYLLKKYRPNLTAIHLDSLDHDQHEYGPGSPTANATLEMMDSLIGELLAGVKAAGLEDSTDVIIVSDHGFLPVDRDIQPNVLLAKAGLLETDKQGHLTGGRIATVANGGSFFIYWPKDQNLQKEVDSALRPLIDGGVIWGVLNRVALAELGADPGAQMALEAPSGAGFGGAAVGDLVVKRKGPGGTHGYLPFRKNLAASFLAMGPDIRRGVNLHRVRMTAIGPTILEALGIENPKFGASAPLKEIFK
jgi:predicted AlkP superfamily pyrophosphatase or phosphodiesterase